MRDLPVVVRSKVTRNTVTGLTVFPVLETTIVTSDPP